MISQGELFDARLLVARHFLGLSLWSEIRGERLRAFQFAQDANVVWGAVHVRR